MNTESEKRYFLVDRRDLIYLKFILEAYEGLSTLSTFDKGAGIVELTVLYSFLNDMTQLITALQQEIKLIEIPPPTTSLP